MQLGAHQGLLQIYIYIIIIIIIIFIIIIFFFFGGGGGGGTCAHYSLLHIILYKVAGNFQGIYISRILWVREIES